MIAADPRPMSSAPLDGTPVLLFVSSGSAIASFWSEERSQKAFGAGDYRPGWYLLDDDSVELDDPTGWESLIHEIDPAYFEDETVAAFRQRATHSHTEFWKDLDAQVTRTARPKVSGRKYRCTG
jgi:hypothetical protein